LKFTAPEFSLDTIRSRINTLLILKTLVMDGSVYAWMKCDDRRWRNEYGWMVGWEKIWI